MIQPLIINDDRFKVYHQKNQGQGPARNLGIKKSSGKYICFVDADDSLAKKYLELLYGEILKTKAEMVCCGINLVSKTSLTPRLISLKADSNKEAILHLLNGKDWGTPVNRIYPSELIKDIRFPKGISEDKSFIFEMLIRKKISKVAYINQCLYHYHLIGGSSTHSISLLKIDRLLENMIARPYKLLKESEYYASCYNEIKLYLITSLTYILGNIVKNSAHYKRDLHYFKKKFDHSFGLKFIPTLRLILKSNMTIFNKSKTALLFTLFRLESFGYTPIKIIYLLKTNKTFH